MIERMNNILRAKPLLLASTTALQPRALVWDVRWAEWKSVSNKVLSRILYFFLFCIGRTVF